MFKWFVGSEDWRFESIGELELEMRERGIRLLKMQKGTESRPRTLERRRCTLLL